MIYYATLVVGIIMCILLVIMAIRNKFKFMQLVLLALIFMELWGWTTTTWSIRLYLIMAPFFIINMLIAKEDK